MEDGATYRREPAWPRPGPPPAPTPAPPFPPPRDEGDRRFTPARVALAAVVALALVGAVAVFLLTRGGGSPTVASRTTDTSTSQSTGPPGGESTTVPPGADSTSVPTPTTAAPGPSPSPTAATPRPTAGLPPTAGGSAGTFPTETIQVTEPPQREVQRCYVFRGTASLRSGRSLVVAVRDQGGGTHFETVTAWAGTPGQGAWSRSQYFAGAEAVGQTFMVSFLVLDTSTLNAVLAAHGSTNGAWNDFSPPAGAGTLTSLDVRRVPGDGTC